MRSCERYELLASLVLDGEASEKEQAELKAHLEACPACRTYFEDIQRIHGAFAQEEIVVPEGFAVRVMDRVRETRQEQPEENKKTIPFPHWRRWAALAACCAVAVLSLWAVRGAGGVKDAMTTADTALQTPVDTQSIEENAAAQEPEAFAEDGGTAVEDAVLAEAPPPEIPEAYGELAKSAAKDGEAEGGYQPPLNDAPETGQEAEEEPVEAAVAPADAVGGGEPDTSTDRMDATAAGIEELPVRENQAEPEEKMEEAEASAPEEAPDAVEEPAEAGDEVEPVEVIGVPEPGILIVYGSAAQAWVENTLGMEWAVGGSYPLTAEQYGGLLQTLEEAGELYRVEPGEGYCLMTE